ncbi:MAG: hypothetical protein KAI47_17920 [Deltaproteobacteria bacterium]|nr:hypothetical protein [Deltaproteobacteria bacterium]
MRRVNLLSLTAFAAAVVVVPGCFALRGGGRSAALGHESPFVKGIRIVRAKTARHEGLVGHEEELRFGANQDGTRLILDFLERAHRRGGRYVSDIRIELAVSRGGKDLRCQTKLVPFARGMKVPVKVRTPGHTVTTMVMKPVTRTVTENHYECRSVMRPVNRMVTRYEYRYDYSTKSSRSVPVMRNETRYESRQECKTVTRTRMVTRYEYQYKTKYIPPKVSIIAKHFTDFDLLESKPVCQPRIKGAPPASGSLPPPPHRIIAIVYGGPKGKTTPSSPGVTR